VRARTRLPRGNASATQHPAALILFASEVDARMTRNEEEGAAEGGRTNRVLQVSQSRGHPMMADRFALPLDERLDAR